MELKITCTTDKKIAWDALEPFQDGIKTLPKKNKDKLKASILNHGFSFPIFMWNNKIIDGHQRIAVLKELSAEGIIIPEIPVVEIQAKDEKEAKQKILLASSGYGLFDSVQLETFIEVNEVLVDEINLLGTRLAGEGEGETDDDKGGYDKLDEGKMHTCPECGYEFES